MRNGFLHVPKCAGSSMKAWCINNEIDYIGHDIRIDKKIPSGNYDNVFAFVRNPLDRVVSAYHYLRRGGGSDEDRRDGREYCKHEDFKKFVMEDLSRSAKEQIHFMPMHFWLYDRCEVKATKVGKYENLLEDYTRIANEMGLVPFKKVPHVNPTQHKPYEEMYDQESKDKVYEVYKKDFKLFGYDHA